MTFLTEAKAIEQEIIAHRRKIHQNPELGLDLPMTVAYVKEKLIEMGYEPKDCGRGGVVATVGKPGKTIILRGDMDALPMKECTDEPFKSCNDWMHSCGHDTHTAMLLGAAKILKAHEAELAGTVKLMFQPGEEILAGAKEMIDNGLLENPKVDAAFAIHISSGVKSGNISYCNRYSQASADKFVIKIQGKGGHGASPEMSRDPINAAAHLLISLQEINAREISGRDLAILTIGHLWAGDKENIIPDFAMMEGTIRTYDNSVRLFMQQRIEEMSEAIAKAFRCEASVEWPFGCPPNENDVDTQEEIIGYLKDMLGEDKVELAEGSMGSEDFSWVSQSVPSMFISLGARPADRSKIFPHHNPFITFDERAFHVGTACYVQAAVNWLKNHRE